MPSGIKINELPRAAQVSGSNLIAVESPAGTGTEAATVEQLRDYVAHDALEAISEAAGDAVEAVEEKGAETLASIPEDYTKVTGDVADLKSAFEDAVIDENNLYDTSYFWSNDTAIANNGDGSFTVGTGDYGRAYFGAAISLKPGVYYLYGVPNGEAFLSTDYTTAGRFASNNKTTPKTIVIEEAIRAYLCFRLESSPSTSFVIRPFLYRTKIGEESIADLKSIILDPTNADLLSGNYTNVNETWRGITYTWDGEICHVTGQATGTTFTDIVDSKNSLLSGMKPGGTYYMHYSGEYVSVRVFIYENGTFNTSSIYTSNTDGFFTIPLSATGILVRLYVTNTAATIDEYVGASITSVNAIEKMVWPHKIAFFGDSIMLGRDGDGSSTTITTYTIPYTVSKRLGILCDNLGIGGSGWITRGSDGKNAYEKISTTDISRYTDIVLCYGVNDGFNPIGDYDTTDETTCLGQFNKVINYIYAQTPSARVIVIAPFNGRNVGSFPKFWYGTVPTTAYSRGLLSDALSQACAYYNIPYIKQDNGPINGFTIQTLIGTDGVHPNESGYKSLGGWISGEIAKLIG